jgi:hypothetical protein
MYDLYKYWGAQLRDEDLVQLTNWHIALAGQGNAWVLAWSNDWRPDRKGDWDGSQVMKNIVITLQDAIKDAVKSEQVNVTLWDNKGNARLPGGLDCALPRALVTLNNICGNLRKCQLAEQHFSVNDKTSQAYINHSVSCKTCTVELPEYLLKNAP